MPKTENILEIGSYRVLVRPEETRAYYETLPVSAEPGAAYFRHLMKTAAAESKSFLSSLGIDWEKIEACRPLTEPDERGEILYLACAPFCGTVLSGGDTEPRQSEEESGLSMIFVSDAPYSQLRFVIPLTFDATYFQ